MHIGSAHQQLKENGLGMGSYWSIVEMVGAVILCSELVRTCNSALALHSGGKVDEELRIQAPLESAFAALLLTCLPGLLYLVVHFSVLSEGRHTWSVLLLFSVPTLYLSMLKVHAYLYFRIPTSLCSTSQQSILKVDGAQQTLSDMHY